MKSMDNLAVTTTEPFLVEKFVDHLSEIVRSCGTGNSSLVLATQRNRAPNPQEASRTVALYLDILTNLPPRFLICENP